MVLEFWVQGFQTLGPVSGPNGSEKRTRNRPQALFHIENSLSFSNKNVWVKTNFPISLSRLIWGRFWVRMNDLVFLMDFAVFFRIFSLKVCPLDSGKMVQRNPETESQNDPKKSRKYMSSPPSSPSLSNEQGALVLPMVQIHARRSPKKRKRDSVYQLRRKQYTGRGSENLWHHKNITSPRLSSFNAKDKCIFKGCKDVIYFMCSDLHRPRNSKATSTSDVRFRKAHNLG